MMFPSSHIEAEQALLGCALLDAECARQLVASLSETDFSYEPHRHIFRAIREVWHRQLTPDIVTVHGALQDWRLTDFCGGLPYLIKLSETPPSIANFADYLAIVKSTSQRRKVWELAQQLSQAVAQGDGWQKIVEQLQVIATADKTQSPFPLSVLKSLGDIQPLPTNWLVPEYIPIGAVTLLAGEGGHGKTSLLCHLAASVLRGGLWLGKFPVPQGGVITIVGESIQEVRTHLQSYGITDDDPLVLIDLSEWEGYTPLQAAKLLPQLLAEAKRRLGDVPIRLITLDPLRGFGFDEKQATRQRKDSLPTIREIYAPLTNFANAEGVAVVVAHHFRKLQPDERRRLYPRKKKGKEIAPDLDANFLRSIIAGTADIVNAARQVLVLVSDLEAGMGTIVPVKSNRSQGLGAPLRYDWNGDEPVFVGYLDEDESAINRAIAFLKQALRYGAMPSEELKAQAEKQGIARRTLWRAKARLGIVAQRRDDGVWVWRFPQDIPTKANFGTLTQKPQQNNDFLVCQEVCQTQKDVAHLAQLCQVCQTQNGLAHYLAHLKTPVNTGVSDEVCQVCQTSLEHHPDIQNPSVCNLCGNKLSEISATPTCPHCWTSGEEIVARCDCGEPLRWDGVGRARCSQCGRQWRWVTDQWRPDEPAPNEPPDQPSANTIPDQPADPVSVAFPDQSEPNGERLVETETWLAQLDADIATRSELSPTDNPAPPPKEAMCPRCGHRESVDAKVLLPPLCPACGATMEWVASAPV